MGAAIVAALRSALMASKDKGGRATKTVATKTAKEKKQEKAAKKAGKGSGSSS